MFCRNCGKQIDDSAAFCTNCGTRVRDDSQVQQQHISNPEPVLELAPINKRNIGICAILTVVTLGIYGIYWFICMVDDANEASRETGSMSGGMVFLLTLLTCGIYEYYWMYKVGGQLVSAKKYAKGVGGENNGVVYLLLSLMGVGIASYCLIQNELNQVADGE